VARGSQQHPLPAPVTTSPSPQDFCLGRWSESEVHECHEYHDYHEYEYHIALPAQGGGFIVEKGCAAPSSLSRLQGPCAPQVQLVPRVERTLQVQVLHQSGLLLGGLPSLGLHAPPARDAVYRLAQDSREVIPRT